MIMPMLKKEVKKNNLGGSGRALLEGQGEFSRRVRESTLGGSGRVLSEVQGEFSQRECQLSGIIVQYKALEVNFKE